MSIAIVIPAALREYAQGQNEVSLEAANVGGALDALTLGYPALRRQLFAESGELRPYVNVYLNADEVRDLPGGLNAPVQRGDTIMILPSIAGG